MKKRKANSQQGRGFKVVNSREAEEDVTILRGTLNQHQLLFIQLSEYFKKCPLTTELIYKYYGGRRICIFGETTLHKSDLLKLLEACLSMLVADCEFCKECFDWSKCHSQEMSRDPEIIWLVRQCQRMLYNTPEEDIRREILNEFGESKAAEMSVKFHHIFSQRTPISVDEAQISQLVKLMKSDNFKPSFTKVEGVLLLSNPKTEDCLLSENVVLFDSYRQSLRTLAASVQKSTATIIEGPIGCGKTLLIEHLASHTGRSSNLIKIQMGDQIDGKSLIGSYICTEVPGEFVWKAGPLSKSVVNGYWLLIEDIDIAPPDVISTFAAVIRTRSLNAVPGCPVNGAFHNDFRIFFTRRTNSSKQPAFCEIDYITPKITMKSPTREEVEFIVISKWPQFQQILPNILNSYEAASDFSKLHHRSRSISLRDITKWCHRLSEYYNPNTNAACASNAFQDAVDCFVSHPLLELALIEEIGGYLNISKPEARRLVLDNHCLPNVSETFFSVGRATLPRSPKDLLTSGVQPTFAFTKHSLRLLEKIATAINSKEPVLLVGETGTGKTSTVQFLASELGQRLTVVNLNQQSESIDLIGGYKPIDFGLLMKPILETFYELFKKSFVKDNREFLLKVDKCFKSRRYFDLISIIKLVFKKAEDHKLLSASLKSQWNDLESTLDKFCQKSFKEGNCVMIFSFIEGSLMKALKEGSWILLDEVNLAEAETLLSLSLLLDALNYSSDSFEDAITQKKIEIHPNFRLFACMNPATDVGKRDLPHGLRNRFTEFFVDELDNEKDLQTLIQGYLPSVREIQKISRLYLSLKQEATITLSDTTGHRPLYSLRTLCRALSTSSRNPCGDMSRSIYEAFCLSFLTQLDAPSRRKAEQMICQELLGKNAKSVISKKIPRPEGSDAICFEGFWISRGPEELFVNPSYIFTKTITQNLKDLARIVSLGKGFPILLQGETGVGKTSLITWLAKATGNVCRRVNNHEHTDLEEYVGRYCSSESGQLVFQEGVLVEAMRKGYWIILDELNLAPTEILEAINRALDDNRELFIPETRTIVKAHPNFLLFATQNPPGLYGGRKTLSRAFRNRFVELHFDEIPKEELVKILEHRCLIPASYANKMVNTMNDLQLNRKGSQIFAGKSGFITLRDLFRWGDRYKRSLDEVMETFFDWDLHLAYLGYIILAGRVRNDTEVHLIQTILEKQFLKNKKSLDPDELINNTFSENIAESFLQTMSSSGDFQHLVPTRNMKRLAVFLWDALKHGEPVLLVGDTGCGKTSACQLYAYLHSQLLTTVNCHMHSEGADFLGGLRPVRNPQDGKLFEWVDGPLVKSMKEGNVFLIDEISLADDSVLERINSVLEPEKTLLLAEKGMENNTIPLIVAHEKFALVATMNPGGDFGKKELSLALRNRFTEIWCPSAQTEFDIKLILRHNLRLEEEESLKIAVNILANFYLWFLQNVTKGTPSIRDLLSWIEFINISSLRLLSLPQAIYHGAEMVFIEPIRCGMSFVSFDHDTSLEIIQENCRQIIQSELSSKFDFDPINECRIVESDQLFGIHPFCIELLSNTSPSSSFTFDSLGVRRNTFKVLRALQVKKPILLEGAPGVGKTSLVQALAQHTGRKIVRINLSEQTDISDLFGSDLPVEGENTAGKFAWRDGPLLQALKSQSTWIILDELNLASQSVLEGLNACFDHRGEIFIPELAKTFLLNKECTRIFACQNPYSQGGDRKGLPKSFLNRFTSVNIEPFQNVDLELISRKMFPLLDPQLISKITKFTEILSQDVSSHKLGSKGFPWEFNLRDILRTCHLITSFPNNLSPSETLSVAVNTIFMSRFRTPGDKILVENHFNAVFESVYRPSETIIISPTHIEASGMAFPRSPKFPKRDHYIQLVPSQKSVIAQLVVCINMNWLSLLVGSTEQSIEVNVEALAQLTGNTLRKLHVNEQMDAVELLGGFEQKDLTRKMFKIEKEFDLLVEELSSVDKNVLLRWMCLKQELRPEVTDINTFKSKLAKISNFLTSFEKNDKIRDLSIQLNDLTRIVEESSDLSCQGSFEWIDSPLITSLKDGSWLLLENVNLCPASVLDRLNSLFEPEGSIAMTERGSVDGRIEVVYPHRNFRLFMTMDPKNGEISRAMRNRAVEVFVSDDICKSENHFMDVWAHVGDCSYANVVSNFRQIKDCKAVGASSTSSDFVHQRIFLELSSSQDVQLRIHHLSEEKTEDFTKTSKKLRPFVDALKLLTGNPHHPFDSRLVSSCCQPDKINSILLKLYVLMNSLSVNLENELKLMSLEPSDEAFFELRLYSQVSNVKDDISLFLKEKFLLRLINSLPEYDFPDPSESFTSFHSWTTIIEKLTSNLMLKFDAQVVKMGSEWMNRSQDINLELKNLLYEELSKPTEKGKSKIFNLLQVAQPRPTETPENIFILHQATFFFAEEIQLVKKCPNKRKLIGKFEVDSKTSVSSIVHPLHRLLMENNVLSSEYLLCHLLHGYFVKTMITSSTSTPATLVLASTLPLLYDRYQIRISKERNNFMRHHLAPILAKTSFEMRQTKDLLFSSWAEFLLTTFSGQDKNRSTLASFLQDLEKASTIQEEVLVQMKMGIWITSIFLPIHPVDPCELNKRELLHLEKYHSDLILEIRTKRRMQMFSAHPHLELMEKSRESIENRIKTLSATIRQRTSDFPGLSRSCLKVKDLLIKFQSIISEDMFQRPETKEMLLRTYQMSLRRCCDDIFNSHPDFLDLTSPFLVGLCFVDRSLQNFIQIFSTRKAKTSGSDEMLMRIFQSFGDFFNTDFFALHNFLQSDITELISFCKNKSCSTFDNLIISSLQDLQNLQSLTQHHFSQSVMKACSEIVDRVVKSWKTKRLEEKEKEETEEALFLYKMNEDDELHNYFPSFRHEFANLGTAYDNDLENENKSNHNVVAKDDFIVNVIDHHRKLVNHDSQVNFLLPSQHKFSFMAEVLSKEESLCFPYATTLFPYMTVEMTRKLESAENRSIQPSFNIYKDFCPAQTAKCFALIHDIVDRVHNLLTQFHEHPTLVKIQKISERILSFEAQSPLIKLLTGLELLLEECHEWDKVWAHSNIKLGENIVNLTNLIIEWRKLELTNWGSCLESVATDAKKKDLVKWWFYLYDLVQESDDKLSSETNLFESLRMFLEGSSIGQFEQRLELIYLFAKHLELTRGDRTPNSLLLKNLYNFYRLYLGTVNETLNKERSLIEKEVKNFVKIMKWNDINFWSLKSSIEKSHKTLHKYMKTFEMVLQRQSHPLLVRKSQSEAPFIPQKLSKENHIHRPESDIEYPIIPNFNLLMKNLPKISNKILSSVSPMQTQIEELNNEINDMIQASENLKNLSVPSDVKDPEQRKKLVHHIHNRKRKGLHDLFDHLSNSGVSWSAGIRDFTEFDVNLIFQTTDDIHLKESEVSESCNRYFYSCIDRFIQFSQSVTSPSSQLTPNMLDRMKGFSGKLMSNLIRDRRKLSETVSQLSKLQKQSEKLSDQHFVVPEVLMMKAQVRVLLEKVQIVADVAKDEDLCEPDVDYSSLLKLTEESLLLLTNPENKFPPLTETLENLIALLPEKSPPRLAAESLLSITTKNSSMPNYNPSETDISLIFLTMRNVERLQELTQSISGNECSLESFQNAVFSELGHLKTLSKKLEDFVERTRFASNESLVLFLNAWKPFVKQYQLLVQFLTSLVALYQRHEGKKIYFVLDLFTNLCKDGFCLPPEMENESKEGLETSDMTGTGIAEGEGLEDVSKDITSEDQLENAFQDGQEELEDEKDCQKEEDGLDVDMDFEGKNYDMNNEENEDEKSEAGKDEMGKNDDSNATQYDKKLWEGDDEEDDEQDMEDAERTDAGETIGDDKLGAREGLENEGQPKNKDSDSDEEFCDVNENELDDEYSGEKEEKSMVEDVKQEAFDDIEVLDDLNLDEMDEGSVEDGNEEMEVSEDDEQAEAGEQEGDQLGEEDEDEDKMSQGIPEELKEPEKQLDSDPQTEFTPDMRQSSQPDAIPSDGSQAKDNSAGDSGPDQPKQEDDGEGENAGNAKSGDSSEGLKASQNLDSNVREGETEQSSKTSFTQSQKTKRSSVQDSVRPPKRQHILPNSEQMSTQAEDTIDQNPESRSVQHVDESEEANDIVIDVAVDKSDSLSKLVEDTEEKVESEVDTVDNKEEEEKETHPQQEKAESFESKNLEEASHDRQSVDVEKPVPIKTEGEVVPTSTVPRTSFFDTKQELLQRSGDMSWMNDLSTISLFTGSGSCTREEASTIWEVCGKQVTSLVHELCQQLQLVLEPTKSSKLKGDYRTGKRINMRKVIAYIASQFRKDKIWMRRSKPSKRNYQIILAIDDSQSMADTQSKMMAFESFALLSKSLSFIEAGQLAAMSFGEETRLLHPFSNNFSDSSGIEVLSGFSFSQKKTRIASLLESSLSIFHQNQKSSDHQICQLLLIISDGRGLSNEGEDGVQRMVRRLNDSGIFCVFIILDNINNSQSICDIQSVSFESGVCVRTPYLDKFPFPFYIILREISSLPLTLGESLRQWFELVTQE